MMCFDKARAPGSLSRLTGICFWEFLAFPYSWETALQHQVEVFISTRTCCRDEVLDEDEEQVPTTAGGASSARAQEKPRRKRDALLPKGTVISSGECPAMWQERVHKSEEWIPQVRATCWDHNPASPLAV